MRRCFFYLLSFFVAIVTLSSCKDSDKDDLTRDNKINKWIYENMSYFYLWSDDMPRRPNYDRNPEDFFYSLLKPYNQQTNEGDRFSWIQSSYVDLIDILNGVSSDIGFDFYTIDNPANTKLQVVITYVKNGTDASTKVKRGDYIVAVNGKAVTNSNIYELLYANKDSYKLTLYDKTTDTERVEDVSVMRDFAEDPIYLSKTFTIEGKTIGYLVYNFFANDKGDRDMTYDRVLNNEFEKFKQAGVKDLVLDLRYNGGGTVNSAIFMASALVKNRRESDIFCLNFFNKHYGNDLLNDYGEDIMKEYFFDRITRYNDDNTITEFETISKLGDQLNNIYILTGRYTASASELIINGLKPYLGDKMQLIGELTYGKNVGSITLYEENNPNNRWGMQPIVIEMANKEGFSDYAGGFTPDHYIQEINILDGILKPLGDLDEPLLATAIAKITSAPIPYPQTRSMNSNISITGYSPEKSKNSFNMLINRNKYKVNKPNFISLR